MSLFYNWKIGGEAGYGIMNTGGPVFAKILLRAGFFVFVYSEYPSLIRGGHNTSQVSVSKEPINAPYTRLNQLVALNTNTIVWHQNEVQHRGIVVYDEGMIKISEDGSLDTSRIPRLTGVDTLARSRASTKIRQDITFIGVDFKKISQEIGGTIIMRNIASIGSAIALFERESKQELFSIGNEVIADLFANKGEKVIGPNRQVFEAGYKAISDKCA